MTLAYDAAVTSPAAIIAVVEDAGYGASVKGALAAQGTAERGVAEVPTGTDAAEKETRAMRRRLLISILFLLPTMYLAMSPMLAMWGVPYAAGFQEVFWGAENALTFALAQFVLVLPIMYVNRPYYVNGFRNLLYGAPNMDTLVGIGSMASALFGVFAMFRMSWGLGHGDLALAGGRDGGFVRSLGRSFLGVPGVLGELGALGEPIGLGGGGLVRVAGLSHMTSLKPVGGRGCAETVPANRRARRGSQGVSLFS